MKVFTVLVLLAAAITGMVFFKNHPIGQPRFFVMDKDRETIPARADSASSAELKWDALTEVELVAEWKSEKLGLNDVNRMPIMDHYILVRHKSNPQVAGWVFPLYLWYGPVQCPKCGHDASIRESGWGEGARDLDGHKLACEKCGTIMPTVARPSLSSQKPVFVGQN